MALSGSTNFEPNVTEFIEEAYERCGAELRTGYDLKTAIRSVNLMLAEWANRGLTQWTIEQATQTVTEGTTDYSLNSNVIDILDVVLRRTINQTQTDISMNRVSRSEYLNIPNKETQGSPSQFFVDRQITPVVKLWPTPENSTDQFISYRIQRIDDVTASNEDPEVPSRFIPCMVSGLAYYIALKKNPERIGILKQQYEQDFKLASDEDRNRASLMLTPARRFY